MSSSSDLSQSAIQHLHDLLHKAGWSGGVDGEFSDGTYRCGAVYTLGQIRIFVSLDADRRKRYVRDLDRSILTYEVIDNIVDQLLIGQFPPDLFVPSIRRETT